MNCYFSLQELCATGQDIDNIPGWAEVANLSRLVENLLNPVRELAKKAVHVNSGYRCLAINKLVKGATNSAHLRGEAADITLGCVEENKYLFEKIIASGLTWDQIILEKGGCWLHLAYVASGNRRQVLRLP